MIERWNASLFSRLSSISVGPLALWGLGALGLLVLAIAANASLPVARVGDGMEYYGLFYAWEGTMRPWMTDASFDLYQRLHASGTIIGTLDRGYLEAAFRKLNVGHTADFNHFWFYSLLAAISQAPLARMGIQLGAHTSFLLLHSILFFGLLAIAAIYHGRRGFLTIVVLTLGSPVVWYFNKVHTEFFTYCLTLAGVILAMRNHLLAGALLMALAATQNPGLSFVPVVMVALRGVCEWSRPYSRWEVAAAVLTVLVLALHPAYYFIRYEVVTPQLLAGGAAPGAGLAVAYIWLLDPDVGLFPNWPFGLVLVLLGALWWRSFLAAEPRLRPENSLHFWLTIGVFFAASMYSHASTENLNSGATPGLARYALWYIPLVYPLALAVIAVVDSMTMKSRAVGTVGLTIGVVATGTAILSVQWESYTEPSAISRLVQTYTPWLYTPPAEIFGERYSGYGDSLYAASAVVGPDCRKTLLLPPSPEERGISVSPHCEFDGEQIRNWVTSEQLKIKAPTFLRLDPKSIEPQQPIVTDHVYSHDGLTGAIRMAGWSEAEPKHRWSNAATSSIRLLLPQAGVVDRCIILDGFTYGRQRITASLDGEVLLNETFEGEAKLLVPVARRSGLVTLSLSYSDPKRPPDDDRLLAYGLRSFILRNCR